MAVKATYPVNVIAKLLDLTIRRGKIVGLLGRNGAGKTTTLRCIVGIIPALTLTGSEELVASLIQFAIALPFFVVFFWNRNNWWALIPAFTLADLAPPFLEHAYFEGHDLRPFQPDASSFNLANAWWLAEASTLAYADEAFSAEYFKSDPR